MEKLYELLNEFIKEKNILIIDGSIYNIDINQFLTKKAGFIERLVKNDKIDLNKLMATEGCPTNGWGRETEGYSNLERLLMILSIQENPIEYLISILK